MYVASGGGVGVEDEHAPTNLKFVSRSKLNSLFLIMTIQNQNQHGVAPPPLAIAVSMSSKRKEINSIY